MSQDNGTAEVVQPTLEDRMGRTIEEFNRLAQHIQSLQAQLEGAERRRQQAIGQMNMLRELMAEAES